MSFADVEKADLHVHLNGAVPSEVIERLAQEYRVTLPKNFDISQDLTLPSPVKGLQDYLKPWLVFKKFPIGQACLDLMVNAAFKAFADDHVTYVEARNSPFNISELNAVSLADSIWWLVESFQHYGREHSVEAKLVLSLDRLHRSRAHAETLVAAIRSVRQPGTIVGLDISGGEDAGIDSSISRLFRDARDGLGLGIAVHAGEEGSTEMLDWAIRDCRVERIGHGLALVKSEELMEEALEYDICVEVCLSTNYLSGQVREMCAHLVKEFIDRDIPFVLCSDNPAVNCSPLSREYSIFKSYFGDAGLLDEMNRRTTRFRLGQQTLKGTARDRT